MSTFEELEEAICGKNYIDVPLLKRHTKYAGEGEYVKDSRLMQDFWEFMDELSPDDRRQFIKFCWGQTRLPQDDAAWERQNLNFKMMPIDKKDNPDGRLPKAKTCFFQFFLPAYSNKDIMRFKIRQAIEMDNVAFNED